MLSSDWLPRVTHKGGHDADQHSKESPTTSKTSSKAAYYRSQRASCTLILILLGTKGTSCLFHMRLLQALNPHIINKQASLKAARRHVQR